MQFGEGKSRQMSKTLKGLNVKQCLTPSGLLKKLIICLPELHSGLFMFNPFGIFRFVVIDRVQNLRQVWFMHHYI